MKIDDTAQKFIEKTRIAVLSTVDKHNKPHSVPIWYSWDNGEAFMFTGINTQKWKNLLQNPFATLCVDDREPPYQSVIIHGKVEQVQVPLNQFVKSLSVKYYGLTEGVEFSNLFPDDAEDVVVFKLIPSKIVSDLQK
ncbi:MAG: pyridoxamine 5'-phosphate oxidase family protein [Dehalococcoidia bacterium]